MKRSHKGGRPRRRRVATTIGMMRQNKSLLTRLCGGEPVKTVAHSMGLSDKAIRSRLLRLGVRLTDPRSVVRGARRLRREAK